MKRTMTVTAIVLGMTVGSALAGFTRVTGPGEMSIKGLLDGIYGATDFVPNLQNAGTYSSASTGITAVRVDDYGVGSPLHLLYGYAGGGPVPSSGDDSYWTDGIATITAEAKYSSYSQAFGYTDAAGYHELFEYTGPSGLIAPGTVMGSVDLTGTNWVWDRSEATGDALPGANHWQSAPSGNSDYLDHMITFEILGPIVPENGKVWLLLWDDDVYGGESDFNDFAVQIVAIPAPAAVVMGVFGLGLVGWWMRRYA